MKNLKNFILVIIFVLLSSAMRCEAYSTISDWTAQWFFPTAMSSSDEAIRTLQSLKGAMGGAMGWVKFDKLYIDANEFKTSNSRSFVTQGQGTTTYYNGNIDGYYSSYSAYTPEYKTTTISDEIHIQFQKTLYIRLYKTPPDANTSSYGLISALSPWNWAVVTNTSTCRFKTRQSAELYANAIYTLAINSGNVFSIHDNDTGLILSTLTDEDIQSKHLASSLKNSVYVKDYYLNTYSANAGFKINDIILAINGNPNITPTLYYHTINALNYNNSVMKFKILRDNKEQEITIKYVFPAPPAQKVSIGITAREANNFEINELNIKTKAIVITDISKNGFAEKNGLKVNDIITAFNDNSINNIDDCLKNIQETDEFVLTIVRAKKTYKININKKIKELNG